MADQAHHTDLEFLFDLTSDRAERDVVEQELSQVLRVDVLLSPWCLRYSGGDPARPMLYTSGNRGRRRWNL